jgi:hypothetical protein
MHAALEFIPALEQAKTIAKFSKLLLLVGFSSQGFLLFSAKCYCLVMHLRTIRTTYGFGKKKSLSLKDPLS